MLHVDWAPYTLKFKEVAITSRETMLDKATYFIKIFDPRQPDKFAIGECALFKGLSREDTPIYQKILNDFCRAFNRDNNLTPPPLSSIRFGFETALADWHNGAVHTPFPSPWTHGEGGMKINGLVWMGTIEQMYQRAQEKIQQGFRCIKFKIGSHDFESELELLESIRAEWSSDLLEIRLDANGAFSPEEALTRLHSLSRFDIHSIEQPIAPYQWHELEHICRKSPIPIALDEELIGTTSPEKKKELLKTISPAYIILKPSLCGGFQQALQWIDEAERFNIGWWVTSALESAVGLNAIASWTSKLDNNLPQGLGTGRLYSNDFISPLYMEGQYLYFNSCNYWSFPHMDWQIVPD